MVKSPCANAGNTNLKGKKYKLMPCKCCDMIDFRERENEKAEKKITKIEIRDRGFDYTSEAIYY